MTQLKDSVPLYPAIDPQASVGFFLDGGAYSKNVMLEVYSDNKYYVTQRPGLDVVANPETWVSVDPNGRGIYYWQAQETLITVVGEGVFTGGGVQLGTITAGLDPVWMGAIGDYLVIIDHENDQGWYIDGGLTVTQINDPDFPTELAGGGAVLNGVLYVLSEDGTIYNSGFNDPTTWNALDFLNAEREPDGGEYITKFLDHVVVFGSSTIEFFYDAGNPVGSPLRRREDISYRIGALDAKSVYNSGDVIYFISADVSGSLKLQSLQGFELVPLSSPQLDRYMQARQRGGQVETIISGSHVNGHLFVYITFVVEQEGSWLVQETLVFDAITKHFTEFSTRYPGIDFFPVVSWTVRQGSTIAFSFGLLTSGHVVRWSGSVVPIDQFQNDPYFSPGYIAQGYISSLTGVPEQLLYVAPDYIEVDYIDEEEYIFEGGSTIEMTVRTETWDADSHGPVANHNKFIHKTEVVGARLAEYVDEDEVMRLRWTDDNYDTYSSYRSVPVGGKQRLVSCGKTIDRAFELTYKGINRIRVERIDLTFGVSSYA